ncbi:uncharacterized protein [Lolium perenne]|uniref:uncharacterized protein n=1 Tax=Lolium perenne TaxID=4522 RepID=UPI003A9A1448
MGALLINTVWNFQIEEAAAELLQIKEQWGTNLQVHGELMSRGGRLSGRSCIDRRLVSTMSSGALLPVTTTSDATTLCAPSCSGLRATQTERAPLPRPSCRTTQGCRCCCCMSSSTHFCHLEPEEWMGKKDRWASSRSSTPTGPASPRSPRSSSRF